MFKALFGKNGDKTDETPSEDQMAASGHAHSHEDIDADEDPREARRRAREALKAAKAQLRATREPLSFNPWVMGASIGGAVFDLVLAFLLMIALANGPISDNIDTPEQSASQSDAGLGTLDVHAKPLPVTDISFSDAKGRPEQLSDYRGQVVVLNVWASWCTPCKTEMPDLAALQKRYEGTPLKVLAVSIDNPDKFPDAQRFIGLNAPLQFHSTGMDVVVRAFGISGMPATLIIDKQGREVARVNGAKSWDTPEVKALMDKLTR